MLTLASFAAPEIHTRISFLAGANFRCLLAGNRARSVLPDVNKALIYANFIYLQTRIVKYTVETICRRLLTDNKREQNVQSAVSVIIGGREFSQPKSSIYQGKNSVEA